MQQRRPVLAPVRSEAHLAICHQNIRCLTSKTKKLEVLLTKDLSCDILILTEHWLRCHELVSVTLNNFDLVSNYCRPTTPRGGSCIYVRTGIKVTNKQDYCDLSKEQVFDVCAVHLVVENILIIGIYHSNQTNDSAYLELFENLLTKISSEGYNAVIMGDININLLKNTKIKKELVDILSRHNFCQLIDFPTRVDGDTSTLLDHVYSNLPEERFVAVAGVATHLSDHYAQRLTITRNTSPPPKFITRRSLTAANKLSFSCALESIDWSAVVKRAGGDCHALAYTLVNIIVNKFDICFPMKKQPRIHRLNSWVDSEIRNFKNLLFDIFKLNKTFPGNTELLAVAESYSIKYNIMLKEKRTNHCSKIIHNHPNKAKCMWNIINTELGRGVRERVDYTDLVRDENGVPFSSKQRLVDALNLEFTTAATRCGAPSADVARACDTLSADLTACDLSLRLELFSPYEIVKIVNKHIAPKNSTDLYGISSSLLRIIANPLAHVIAHLFNACIREGVYPSALKRVKVSPLYKGKGKKADMKSYRPISLVPAISKIFEVGLNKRLLSFMGERNSMSDRQYAYRAGRGTTDVVREVVWRVLGAREAGLHVALLCCDLSRAFDTADHHLIANKLNFYGIRGPVLSLLTDFMSQRTQTVIGDNGRVKSGELVNTMGVPQGSCLSNTLFSLLLNDLPGAISDAEIYMYADDVAAIITAPTAPGLERRLNSVVRRLERWFQSNGLALNREKTCFMTFQLNGTTPPTYTVITGNSTLQMVQTTKLLGFHIDSGLTWDTHIDELCSRLGRSYFALRRLASTASRKVVVSCYFATVHSILTYGVELWARAADVGRAFVMQKRAVRAIVGVPDDASCRQLFKELDIMPLPCELIYQVALFTFKNIDIFRQRGVNASRALRSNRLAHLLVTPTHRLNKSERSVYIMGPSVYNRLPDTIKTDATSTTVFKIRLRKWLLGHSFYSVKEFYELPII